MAKPPWMKSIVSLSLTEYYCASLAPGSAALVRVRRGWRPKLVQKTLASGSVATASVGTASIGAQGQPWLAELGLLEGLLEEVRYKLPITIIISNYYVRYRLIPAPPLSMPTAEVQALMQHCFRETYGNAVDDWIIRANPLPGRGDVVACAVDRALIDGLGTLLRKSGLKLESVQPYFMAGFNAACQRINGSSSCFVQVELGRIMIGTMRDNTWLGLRAVAADGRWSEELPAHIGREILLAGWENESPAVFLDAPQAVQTFTLDGVHHLNMSRVPQRRVDGYSPLDDAPYAMALRGVR